MGLQSAITKAVSSAVKAVGDLAADVTIVRVLSSPYSPATGKVMDVVKEYEVRGILSDFSAHEIQAGVAQSQDRRLFIQQSDLGFDLQTTDRARVDGSVFQIVPPIKEDPAHASYTIQLRAASS